MSALGITARDSTTCLRCQYRISIGKKAYSQRRLVLVERAAGSSQARRFTLRHGLRQSYAQSPFDPQGRENDTRSFVPLGSKLRSEFPKTTFMERLAGVRRVRGDSAKLEVEALGQPAEILMLRDWHIKKRADQSASVAEEPPDNESGVEESLSPAELLDTVAAERGVTDSEAVSQNIQNFKDSWSSRLEGSQSLPTDAQYNKLAKALNDGFTLFQLQTYLESTKPFHRPQDESLQAEYSAAPCTLSAWVPGSTSFPEGALSRLNSATATTTRYEAGLVPGAAGEYLQLTPKQAVVGTILRRAWNLRTKEELQSMGELDMRFQPEHLDLLLNHRSDIFKRLSEKYEAKIDVARSKHIVRLSADHATCTELSKLMVFLLESIRCDEFDLTPLRSYAPYEQYMTAVERIQSENNTFERIEKITSTIIRRDEGPGPESIRRKEEKLALDLTKVHIYSLGPETLDADDARRLLIQSIRPVAQKEIQLTLSPPSAISTAVPCPVDVGAGLAWFKKDTQWSRFRTPSWKSKLAQIKPDFEPDDLVDRSGNRSPATAIDQFLQPEYKGPPTPGEISAESSGSGTKWRAQVESQVSVLFGQILFPSDAAQALAESPTYNTGTKNSGHSPIRCPIPGCKYEYRLERQMDRHIKRRHRSQHLFEDADGTFSTANPDHFTYATAEVDGPHSTRQKLSPSIRKRMEYNWSLMTEVPNLLPLLNLPELALKKRSSEICIRLSPSPLENPGTLDNTAFPNLELWIAIDENTKTTHLRKSRLIISERESDLLLPDKRVDLRFVAQSYLDNENQSDPSLFDFVQNSNLDIWGPSRIQTPVNLKLSIPRRALRANSHVAGLPNPGNDGGLPVHYVFAGLDHRSQLRFQYEGLEMTLTTIEAGQTGGRRTEVRLLTPAHDPSKQSTGSLQSGEFRVLFDAAFKVLKAISPPPTPFVPREASRKKETLRTRHIPLDPGTDGDQ